MRKRLRKAKRGTTISPLIFLVFFLLPLCLRLRFHPTFESPLSFTHRVVPGSFPSLVRGRNSSLVVVVVCVRLTRD